MSSEEVMREEKSSPNLSASETRKSEFPNSISDHFSRAKVSESWKGDLHCIGGEREGYDGVMQGALDYLYVAHRGRPNEGVQPAFQRKPVPQVSAEEEESKERGDIEGLRNYRQYAYCAYYKHFNWIIERAGFCRKFGCVNHIKAVTPRKIVEVFRKYRLPPNPSFGDYIKV
ncbi:unnamed protein product [Strongylus vulgaris]|uniref:Uncharacterized protein n=1 Tax=Strongylus vulgaris TaxID=40348 RepID=A0A3P7J3C5_STRVU|nr:unnamed protein product [Strongylus vulgaris]